MNADRELLEQYNLPPSPLVVTIIDDEWIARYLDGEVQLPSSGHGKNKSVRNFATPPTPPTPLWDRRVIEE